MNSDKMTRCAEESLDCPKCGHRQNIKKYKTINVTQKGKLKEDILKNRLFQFSCASCGYAAPLTYDSLYVDDKKKLLYYLAPVMTPEVRADLSALAGEIGFTKRLVDNINDLKEKIMIADNHLDDRIIEIIKILYINQIKKEMEDDTLLDILFDYSADSYCFLVFFQKKGIGKIPMTREFYKGIEEKYRDGAHEHSDDKFMKVDMEWAGKILFKKR